MYDLTRKIILSFNKKLKRRNYIWILFFYVYSCFQIDLSKKKKIKIIDV